MKNFYIHNRRISSNDPPLVIAEVGINHEGNINKAFKMIDAAKKGKGGKSDTKRPAFAKKTSLC